MKDVMSTTELASLLGLSAPSIRELQRKGIIGKRGREFRVAETLPRYLAYLRQEHRAALKLPGLPRDYAVHRISRGIDGAIYEHSFETLALVVDGKRVA